MAEEDVDVDLDAVAVVAEEANRKEEAMLQGESDPLVDGEPPVVLPLDEDRALFFDDRDPEQHPPQSFLDNFRSPLQKMRNAWKQEDDFSDEEADEAAMDSKILDDEVGGLIRKVVPRHHHNFGALVRHLQADPSDDTPQVMEEEEAGLLSERIMMDILQRLQRDTRQMGNYVILFRFLVFAVLFLFIVSLQFDLFSPQFTITYQQVRDKMFGYASEVSNDASFADIRMFTSGWEPWSDFLESYVETVFPEEECGNGVCTAGEVSEMPGWIPTEEAGDRFRGCAADCGLQTTTRVTVSFYDAWKLREATRYVNSVLASDPPEHCDGELCYELATWRPQRPIAGWNVCHKSDSEFGTTSQVCIFDYVEDDGVTALIDGEAYRTVELDIKSAFFGQPKELELYEGDWELKFAFDGFVWRHPEKRAPYQIAFPAVRGRICQLAPELYNDDSAMGANCTDWGPCPFATQCNCEFVNGEYVCGDNDNDVPTEVKTLRFDTLSYDPSVFSSYAGIEAVAYWWAVQGFFTRGPQKTPPARITENNIVNIEAVIADIYDDATEISQLLFAEFKTLSMGESGQKSIPGSSSKVGLRFTQMDIPRGSTILDAVLEWTSATDSYDDGEKEALTLLYEAFAVDDLDNFQSSISGAEGSLMSLLPRVGSQVRHVDVEHWGLDEQRKTPNLRSLVQEVVDRSGWEPGNSLGFLVSSVEALKTASRRLAYAYDPTAPPERAPPKLSVRYVRTEVDVASIKDAEGDVNEQGDDGAVFTQGDIVLGMLAGQTEAAAFRFEDVQLLPRQKILFSHLTLTGSGFQVFEQEAGRPLTVAITGELTASGTAAEAFGFESGVKRTPGPYDTGNNPEEERAVSVEAETNFAPFDLSRRSYTTRSILAEIPILEDGATFDTPDLSSLLAELLAQPGWRAGSSIALVMRPVGDDFGTRVARGYGVGSAELKYLVVGEDTNPDPTAEPTVIPSPIPTTTPTNLPTTCRDFAEEGVCESVVALDEFACQTTYCRTCRLKNQCDFTCGLCYSEFPSPIPTPINIPTLYIPTRSPTRRPTSGRRRLKEAGQSPAPRKKLESPTSGSLRRKLQEAGTSPAPLRKLEEEESDELFCSSLSVSGTFTALVRLTLRDETEDVLLYDGLSDEEATTIDLCGLKKQNCFSLRVSETTLPLGFGWSLSGGRLVGFSPFGPKALGYDPVSRGLIMVESCGGGGLGASAEQLQLDSDRQRQARFFAEPAVPYEEAPTETTSGIPPRLRCYVDVLRSGIPTLPTTRSTDCTRSGLYDSMAAVEECDEGETHCFFVESTVASQARSSRCNEAHAQGGCWGKLLDLWTSVPLARQSKVDGEWVGLPPPVRGSLSALQCDMIATRLFDGTVRSTECAGCDTDLCFSQDSETEYSNSFNVGSRALLVAESSLGQGTTVCDTVSSLDAVCHPEFNHIGCNYDNGACCPREDRAAYKIGDDISCGVPWLQTAENTWRYGRVLNNAVFSAAPLALYRATLEKLSLISLLELNNFVIDADLIENTTDVQSRLFNRSTPISEIDSSILDVFVPSLACPECPSTKQGSIISAGAETRRVGFTVVVSARNARVYRDWTVRGEPLKDCSYIEREMTPATKRELCQSVGADNSLAQLRCEACWSGGYSLPKPPQFSDGSAANPRVRYVSKPNVVVFGALLTQERRQGGSCKSGRPFNRFLDYVVDILGQECASDKDSEVPFGRDASLFSDHFEAFHGVNSEILYDLYGANEIDDSQPYGFFYDMGSNGSGKNYPIYWDVNLNSSRAKDLARLVIDGGYFDDLTESVELSLITTNRASKHELIALMSVKGFRVEAGGVKFDWSIQVLDTNLYGEPIDWLRVTLEFIFCFFLGFEILFELAACVKKIREKRSFLDGFLEYFGSFNKFCNLGSFAVAVVMIFDRIKYVRLTQNLKSLKLHYDVYAGGASWNLRTLRHLQYTDQIGEMQDAYKKIAVVASHLVRYKLAALIGFVLIVGNVLLKFDFHPKMGIVTRTITKTGSALLFWCFLQFSISFLFSLLAVLLFRESSEGFGGGTAPGLIQSFAGFGMLSLIGAYDLSELRTIPGLSQLGREMGVEGLPYYVTQFFYWSYMIVSFFIMFNALLAIIVSAYEEVSEEMRNADRDALFFTLKTIAGQTDVGGGMPLQLDQISHLLETWVGDRLFRETSGVDEDVDDLVRREAALEKRHGGNPTAHLAIRTRKMPRPGKENRLYTIQLPQPGPPLLSFDRNMLAVVVRCCCDRHLDQLKEAAGRDPASSSMDKKTAHRFAMNILARYGTKSDLNENGVVSAEEATSIRNLVAVLPVVCDERFTPAARLAYSFNVASGLADPNHPPI